MALDYPGYQNLFAYHYFLVQEDTDFFFVLVAYNVQCSRQAGLVLLTSSIEEKEYLG